MGVKVVLRALFLAYALTGVCLLVLAGLVFWMDIGTGAVTVGIILIYVDLLYGGWISGWKDCQAGEISLGSSVGACLFPVAGNSFVYCEQKLGYERSAYDNNLCMCLGGGTLEECCPDKKCFYLSRIYAILCPEHYT